MEWKTEEAETARRLIREGNSFKQVAVVLGKTYASVVRKLNRAGIKSNYNQRRTSYAIIKYERYDWKLIQEHHDKGLTYLELLERFKLNSNSIAWGKANNKLKFRTLGEGVRLGIKKGNYPKSSKRGMERYRQLCVFKFGVKSYPNELELKLIEKYGWYKAKNRGDNPIGISRDHLFSVYEGFKNGILPYYLRHPANCKLIRQIDNSKKHSKSSITFDELLNKIQNWNSKYGTVTQG